MSYDDFINNKAEFIYYKQRVNNITNKQPLYLLENFHKRGPSGKIGAYHIDHIISVKRGYERGIDPGIIGDIKNLRFIPWKENLEKSSKQTRESDEMLQYFIEQGSIR